MSEAPIPWKDQYKHPLWQKKRLEALEAAEYSCERCYDAENTLHVHHKRYIKGRAIWEYSVSELNVLCESCHGVAHAEKEMLQGLIAKLHPDATGEIIGLIAGYCDSVSGPSFIDLTDDPALEQDSIGSALGRLVAMTRGFSKENRAKVATLIFEIEAEESRS